MSTIQRLTDQLRQKERALERAEKTLRAAEAQHRECERRFATEHDDGGRIETSQGPRRPLAIELERHEVAVREARARRNGAKTEAEAFRQFCESDETRQKAAELDRQIEQHPTFEEVVADKYQELRELGDRIGQLFCELKEACGDHQRAAGDIRQREQYLGLEQSAGYPPSWPDIQRRMARALAGGVARCGVIFSDLERALDIVGAGKDLRSDELEESRLKAAKEANEREAAAARSRARDRVLERIHAGAPLSEHDHEWARILGIDVAAEMREVGPLSGLRYKSDARPAQPKPNGQKQRTGGRVIVEGGDEAE